jgi:hypothetical protein
MKASKTEDACPTDFIAKRNQESGTEVLHSAENKPIPAEVITRCREATLETIRTNLNNIEKSFDAEDAAIYIRNIIAAGWILMSNHRRDLIEAIEHRLPRPTAYQQKRCNLLKDHDQDIVLFGLAIGAFHTAVITLTTGTTQKGRYDLELPPSVAIVTIPRSGRDQVPAWDTTRKPYRRVHPIIDAEYETNDPDEQQPVIIA